MKIPGSMQPLARPTGYDVARPAETRPSAPGVALSAARGNLASALEGSGEFRQQSARPVRINRFPEEAALFAYDRLAQLDARPPAPQVDVYV